MSLSLQRRERTKRLTPLLRHNGLNESFMQGVPGAESAMHRCFVCCVCFLLLLWLNFITLLRENTIVCLISGRNFTAISQNKLV